MKKSNVNKESKRKSMQSYLFGSLVVVGLLTMSCKCTVTMDEDKANQQWDSASASVYDESMICPCCFV